MPKRRLGDTRQGEAAGGFFNEKDVLAAMGKHPQMPVGCSGLEVLEQAIKITYLKARI